jgi:type II secretory pathway component PulK
LAALWLVVAIAAVALQFSLEARERRSIGILTSERGMQRGLALGALSLVQARLDQAMRAGPSTANNPGIAQLRSGDPWFDVDGTFSGPVMVDSASVDVVAHDLGEYLNINQATEQDLRAFFSFLLDDFEKATQLSEAILDWRDADSIPRPNGAERDDYIRAEKLALPTNLPFRDVSDLQDVMGMTPEIYAKVSPYLTTRGNGRVNLNTAPLPVLRALPGMTDATLNTIVQMRSQGRRISSVPSVFMQQQGGRGGRGGGPTGLQTALTGRATATTDMVELTITARVGPQASPTKLTAVIARGGEGGAARVTSLLW